ncbi:MAG: MnhB domain-containing protein [Actinomycetota bacterium]|nr:MnhB domain-containing protein [Actinomycetota bacterium]
MKRILTFFILFLLWLLMVSAVLALPPIGSETTPVTTHVIPRYLEQGVEEAGAENIVTCVILNYRGYDTMGEVTVIFCALIAVLAVVGREDPKLHTSKVDLVGIKESVIVKSVVRFLAPFIMLFAVYIMLHGKESPGGGFQAGAILGASIIIYTMTFSYELALSKFFVKVRTLMEGAGPIAFFACGVVALFYNQNFLTYIIPGLDPVTQTAMRSLMIEIIEVGIGIGGGTVISSIFLAMEKVEK